MPDRTAGQQWYSDYLASAHWTRTRIRKLEEASHACERCGKRGIQFAGGWPNLHVHHLTYERVGKEQMDDLQVLCDYCHAVEHQRVTDDIAGLERTRKRFGSRVAASCTSYDDEIDAEVQAWDTVAETAGF